MLGQEREGSELVPPPPSMLSAPAPRSLFLVSKRPYLPFVLVLGALYCTAVSHHILIHIPCSQLTTSPAGSVESNFWPDGGGGDDDGDGFDPREAAHAAVDRLVLLYAAYAVL